MSLTAGRDVIPCGSTAASVSERLHTPWFVLCIKVCKWLVIAVNVSPEDTFIVVFLRTCSEWFSTASGWTFIRLASCPQQRASHTFSSLQLQLGKHTVIIQLFQDGGDENHQLCDAYINIYCPDQCPALDAHPVYILLFDWGVTIGVH